MYPELEWLRYRAMPEFYKWEGEDLILHLYVQPNAKKDELVGEYGENLKIRITAPPVENKANKYLIKFLAKTFAVAPSRVKLIKGKNQRNKRVKIHSPVNLPDCIIKPY